MSCKYGHFFLACFAEFDIIWKGANVPLKHKNNSPFQAMTFKLLLFFLQFYFDLELNSERRKNAQLGCLDLMWFRYESNIGDIWELRNKRVSKSQPMGILLKC